MNKDPVTGPVHVGRRNLAGDEQADLYNHGGPDKAICVYPRVHYDFWHHEVGPLPLSAFGENLAIVGASEHDVCIGDQWQLGSAVVQISQPRSPCWKVSRRWGTPRLPTLMQQTGRTGWYLRVLRTGVIEAGQQPALIERPHPDWTVKAANDVMYQRRNDRHATAALAALDTLGRSWATKLAARAAGAHDSDEARLDGPRA